MEEPKVYFKIKSELYGNTGDNWVPTQFKLYLGDRLWRYLNKCNVRPIILQLIGVLLGLFYFFNARTRFENVTKFSHLSTTERELSLPVEVAFRYGFYKRIGESPTFLEGLRGIIHDEDVSFPGTFNRFPQFALTPEVIQAGGFHLLKRLTKWNRMDNNCIGGQRGAAGDEPRNGNDRHSCSSESSKNLLSFYFNFIWLIESLTLVVLFQFGFILSESISVSIAATLLFIISHPQRSYPDWLFPSQVKLEWAAFLVQTYVISSTALRRTHPPWTTTVKIGVSTGILIMVGGTEAQWLLISQLVIITLMQIVNLVNTYVTSLIIFGQITGWQYASLVLLDTTFAHWSIYFYITLTCLTTIYVVQPLVDWVLIGWLPKWNNLRRILLCASFVIIFMLVARESRRVFQMSEDSRLSFAFSSDESQFDLKTNLRSEEVILAIKGSDESGGKLEERSPRCHEPSLNISSLLRFCSQSRLKLSPLKFISKYGFHGLLVLYVFSVCVLLPVIALKARRTTLAHTREKRRRASTSHFSSSSSSLNELYSFIQSQNVVIIFNFLQMMAFAFFTVFLDPRWELLFISHVCLIISFCDQKRVSLAYRKKYSNRVGNGANFHWAGVLLAFCIIFTVGKLRSDHMYQNSRGRFHIENEMRKNLAGGMDWINANTEKNSTKFAGLDIPMEYIRLTTGRSCVIISQRSDIHLSTTPSDGILKMKTKFGLTWSESQGRILSSLFQPGRGKSISEDWADLFSLNITHLFLNRVACSPTFMANDREDGTRDSISKIALEPHSPLSGASTFYDWIFHLTENPFTSTPESQITTNGFQRYCEFHQFLVDAKRTENTYKQMETEAPVVTTIKSVHCNRNGQRKYKTDTSANRNRNEVDESRIEADSLCARLLNERNVKPFIRVFENSDYSIFALSQKESSPRARNSNSSRRSSKSK